MVSGRTRQALVKSIGEQEETMDAFVREVES
jgi:hypothetical protein